MLDVVIALCLLFFMLAALVSGIHEALSSFLALRGKMLLRGVASLCYGAEPNGTGGAALADQVLAHPLIDALWKDDRRPPSYVPSRSFALALADTLVKKYEATQPLLDGLPEAVSRMPPGELRDSLSVLVLQARGNAERLQQLVEEHFDQVMNRVSGWYKRQSQWTMLGIGFVVAVALNIDALQIAQRLNRNSELTAALASQAQALAQQGLPVAPPGTAPANELAKLEADVNRVQEQVGRLQSLQLPIGWELDERRDLRLPADFDLPLAIVGWLLSALAASLGAPFWFDALSRLVSLRGSGSKPEAAAASPAQAPATVVTVRSEPAGRVAATVSGPLNDFEASRLTPLDIESVQRAVNLPEPQVTGQLDDSTREAIRRWQQARGLPPTGTLDEPSLFALLYSEHA